MEQSLLYREERRQTRETYEAKLVRIAADITKLSREMDEALAEAAKATENQQAVLTQVQVELSKRRAEEAELNERIRILAETDPAVAQYFRTILEQQDKKNAFRGFLRNLGWFVAGAVVSFLINLATGAIQSQPAQH